MALDDFKDYFKILGVSRNATDKEIKSAFRKLARKFHPDLHPHDERAESEFKEINEAYEILSDEDKKKSYEQFLNYWFKNRDGKSRDFSRENIYQRFDEYLNFDDFLSDLIGRFSEVGKEIYSNISSDNNAQSLNLDAEFNLQISFLEALNGTKKNLLVNDERIEVKIPKGIETGSKIRIKNKGNIQSGKGKRGDLLIEVSIKSHPIWKVKGLDIYADLPLSLDEFALGANITVNDVQRRNRIIQLLLDWGLVSITDTERVLDIAPLNQIKVLAYKEKNEWELETKYNIGKRKKTEETE